MVPEQFCARMEKLLGNDFPAFRDALENGEPVRGLRLNRLLCADRSADETLSFPHTPIPYDPDGFIFDFDGIGHSVLHHGGGVYVQDPGAMSALAAVKMQPGWKVLDLCAAPGGKSAQIAAAIGEEGFLLSNDGCPCLSGQESRVRRRRPPL